MIKKTLIGLMLLAAVSLTGCFDYQEMIVLEKDGSGTIEMRVAMEASMLEGLQAMSQAFSQEDEPLEAEPFISREHIEKSLAEDAKGVKLLHYEESMDEEMKVWDMKFSFKDLSSVQYITTSLNDDMETMNEGEGGESAEAEGGPELSFTEQEDGTWLFVRGMDTGDDMTGMDDGFGMEEQDYPSQDPPEGGEEPQGNMDESKMDEADTSEGMAELERQMEEFSEAMGKMGMKMTVQFPGEVIESNATKVEGNTATWQYNLNEMGQFPDNLRAVIKM